MSDPERDLVALKLAERRRQMRHVVCRLGAKLVDLLCVRVAALLVLIGSSSLLIEAFLSFGELADGGLELLLPTFDSVAPCGASTRCQCASTDEVATQD